MNKYIMPFYMFHLNPFKLNNSNESCKHFNKLFTICTLYIEEKNSVLLDIQYNLIRRMMSIPWTNKLTNEEVLQRAGVERKLIGEIRTRQMRFLGHVIRKDGLENLALTGKMEGKRGRGRKRMLWMTI